MRKTGYYKMKFGKYIGQPLNKIPEWYLKWLLEQDFCPGPVKTYLKGNPLGVVEVTPEDKIPVEKKHPYYKGWKPKSP